MRSFLPLSCCLLLLGCSSSHPGRDLSHLSAGAVPGHIDALRSEEAAARKTAAANLWQIGAEAQEATPALLQAAKDADPEVREAVVKALGRTGQGTQEAIPALREALQDDHAAVRSAAAIALAETWRVAKRSERRDQNRGPSPTSLLPAYEAMAKQIVPFLQAALRDPEARLRASASEALAETGPLAEPAVPDLVQLLQKETDSSARLHATLALGHIGRGAKAAVPILVEKLRGEKVDGVRVNTAVALGMIKSSPETAVPALVETFLKDEHPDARLAAMVSLGRFGAEAGIALPLLRQAAKDPAILQAEGRKANIDQLLKFLAQAGAVDKETK